jgi:hypothetical protein
MTGFEIAALIAMIAGAGMQHKAQSDAAKRQREQAVMAQQRQLNAQNEATAEAAKRAADFDPTARRDNQQQIEQALTGTLDQQVSQPQITAQGVQVGTTLPEGQGGTEYLTAKAREQAKATASLRGLAALMGRIGSASELRRGEAVGIGDTAGAIGRIQGGADNIAGIDGVGVQAAGQPNLGMMIAGQALSAYGGSKLAGSGMKPKNAYGAGAHPTEPVSWL